MFRAVFQNATDIQSFVAEVLGMEKCGIKEKVIYQFVLDESNLQGSTYAGALASI